MQAELDKPIDYNISHVIKDLVSLTSKKILEERTKKNYSDTKLTLI